MGTVAAAGREAMKMSMRLKLEAHAERQACRAAHTCPELSTRTTEGAAACVDGMPFDGRLNACKISICLYREHMTMVI